MNEESRRLLEKADHALAVADELMRSGYPCDAAGKMYYAMFYAAQAVLKSFSIEVTKHSAVEASLGHQFAKTGKIPPELHRFLIDARKIREIADYGIQEDILEPVAVELREKAIRFVHAMKEFLKNATAKE